MHASGSQANIGTHEFLISLAGFPSFYPVGTSKRAGFCGQKEARCGDVNSFCIDGMILGRREDGFISRIF
jgi:hypothetical protein